jgi:glycogen operon protein
VRQTDRPTAQHGDPSVLGATLARDGVNVAVFSSVAEAVDLCLFDEQGTEHRLALTEGDAGIWHGFAKGVGPGQRYGFRVDGPFDPAQGRWCNPAKLLADPYAMAFVGSVQYGDRLAAGTVGDENRPSSLDSAGAVPLSLVVDPAFDWRDDADVRPHHPWDDTVLYELHVRGATMQHPDVPEEARGTYAGLAHDAVIAHLVDLGVTAVELLPVHEPVSERFLLDLGLTNYWGYNTLGYFAPNQRYSMGARSGRPGAQVAEFKAMIAALHRAGIEVVLDVVFNHTAESDPSRPALSLRGLDAAAYYRFDEEHRPIDTTGCGNSLNSSNPTALRLVLDSLRYWVKVCHVDGFRFDLAPTLARPQGRFDPAAPFLSMCIQDPVLQGVKLIAEPWDVGRDDSYALGRFPAPFREWNGKFRDTVRDFWRSEDGVLAELATRFAGSSDLFFSAGRNPTSSINLVTAHDGFTLTDLVTYSEKHNEANGEAGADGTDDNRSWNCGVEGPTDDPDVVALRDRQALAILATLLLSCGVPMLLGGDELGRTQQGNNNAYCQDNPTSWIDWSGVDEARLSFVRRLLELRREHPVFRRSRYLTGSAVDDLEWFTTAGTPMAEGDWDDPSARCVTIYLDARSVALPDERAVPDSDFLVLINGWWEETAFTLPDVGPGDWVEELQTHDPAAHPAAHQRSGSVDVAARSIVVLRGLTSSG